MAEDLKDVVNQAAQSPKKAEGDSGSVEARPIDEIIKADLYQKTITAMTRRHKGLRFVKFKPTGIE